MTAAIGHARTWWVQYGLVVLIVAVVYLFHLMIPALGRISMQAQAGQAARSRQCKTLPIATKVYADAERRGVITAKDLAAFKKASLPLGCKN